MGGRDGTLQLGHLVAVEIDTNHVMTRIGQGNCLYQAYIASTKNADFQGNDLVRDEY